MTSRWSAAVHRSRACDGYAIPLPEPLPAPQHATHTVTVTPRTLHHGVLAYEATCSCGCWLCTDAATDLEARQRSQEHAWPDRVQFATRYEQRLSVVRGDGSVIPYRIAT